MEQAGKVSTDEAVGGYRIEHGFDLTGVGVQMNPETMGLNDGSWHCHGVKFGSWDCKVGSWECVCQGVDRVVDVTVVRSQASRRAS